MDLISQYGPKALTFNISMILYGISFIYIFALWATNRKSSPAKATSTKSSAVETKKPENILQLSEKADTYEEATGHAQRVADLAASIAERFGLPENEIETLKMAALLHDVGQIGRYDFIKENRPLTKEERFELENHTLVGYQKLLAMGHERAAKWVRWHHERWDGLGYPDRLSGAQIPLPVRILSIADAFDAMSHKRPYRSSMTPDGALKELQKYAGIQFDPDIVNVMASMESEDMISASSPKLEI